VRALSCSFSLLWGPCNHLKHLLSAERLPFTVTYFGTMGATVYFALSVSTLLPALLSHSVHHEILQQFSLHLEFLHSLAFDLFFVSAAFELNIKL